MRVELPEGQWADIADVVTHGREKAITKAGLAAREDLTRAADIPTAIIGAFLLAWHVRGEDKQDLPIEWSADGKTVLAASIEAAPDELLVPVLAAIRDIRKSGTAPPNEKAAAS